MPRTIHQTVTLPTAAEKLFDMYLDPAAHAAFTGNPVTIGAEPGAEFQAFGGMISGKILQVVPKRLIVQSWRSVHFHESDFDSTLILSFWAEGDSGRIELIHANIADHDADAVNEGWKTHYWDPWKRHLAGI